jgi:hypothetical protein
VSTNSGKRYCSNCLLREVLEGRQTVAYCGSGRLRFGAMTNKPRQRRHMGFNHPKLARYEKMRASDLQLLARFLAAPTSPSRGFVFRALIVRTRMNLPRRELNVVTIPLPM